MKIINLKILFFIVAILLLSFQSSIAQDSWIQLTTTKRHLYGKYTPFDSVQVLDNRINNTIFNAQTGTYPLPTAGIVFPMTGIKQGHLYTYILKPSTNNTPPTIQGFWQKAIAKMKKGNGKLLVNIKQMRVPNNNSIIGKDYIGGERILISARQDILFSADVYFENKNGYYRKLFSIKKNYFYATYRMRIAKAVPIILNELISISGYIYDKDILNKPDNKYAKKIRKQIRGTVINYSKDTIEYTMNEINVNTRTLWENFPIINKKYFTPGLYITFEDFRDDKLLPYPVQLKYNEIDSSHVFVWSETTDSLNSQYQLPHIKKISDFLKNTFPFSICDGENLYILISQKNRLGMPHKHYNIGIYLKLKQERNTFHFRVPNPLLNMYALLSLGNSDNYMADNPPNTGNALGDVVGGVIMGVVSSKHNHSIEKKITNKGYGEKYRECYIDMDSGDFIYK